MHCLCTEINYTTKCKIIIIMAVTDVISRMFQDSETRLFCGKERDIKIAMSHDQDTITYGFK